MFERTRIVVLCFMASVALEYFSPRREVAVDGRGELVYGGVMAVLAECCKQENQGSLTKRQIPISYAFPRQVIKGINAQHTRPRTYINI